MARLAPTQATIKSLFAKSGNQCAFPDCQQILVDEDDDFVGQICHIAAANSGGERYDSSMTDEQRRSGDNLILLCYPHHVKTNNVECYPVTTLRKMKRDHERLFRKAKFQISTQLIDSINRREKLLAGKLNNIHYFREQIQDIPIIAADLDSDFEAHVRKIEKSILYLEQLLDRINLFLQGFPRLSDDSHDVVRDYIGSEFVYRDSPLLRVFWEESVLGGGNALGAIQSNLLSLRMYLLYAKLREDPDNKKLSELVVKAESELEKFATEHVAYD